MSLDFSTIVFKVSLSLTYSLKSFEKRIATSALQKNQKTQNTEFKITDFNPTNHFYNRVIKRYDVNYSFSDKLEKSIFTQIFKNSSILNEFPHLRNKLREGCQYFFNYNLNMVLCVENRAIKTVLYLDGCDFSDYKMAG